MTEFSYRFGDVVYVEFPFAEMQGAKRRPAVIVSSEPYHVHKPDVLIAAITTKLFPKKEVGEFTITQWHEAGLDQPSRCKAVITTASRTRIGNSVGRFSKEDCNKLQSMLKLSFGL